MAPEPLGFASHSYLLTEESVTDKQTNEQTNERTLPIINTDLYSNVIHHWNRQLKPYSFPLRKNRVN